MAYNNEGVGTASGAYARLSDIAKKNLAQIGSMALYSTPQEYCVNREYIKEDDIKKINAGIRRQPKSFGAQLDFPLMAFSMGYLNEEQTIDVITHFKTIEIVPAAMVRKEKVIYRTFKYDYCKKKKFFEYETDDPEENYFFVSITNFSLFPDFVKRYIPSYKVKIALPNVIDEMLDATQTGK